MRRPALLVLEDGSPFPGVSFGAEGTVEGEVVFNTSMTGYQEVLTDPSYAGQIVTMTAPHIGNVGTNPEDMESTRAWLAGFVVRERSPIAGNFRSRTDLDGFLREQGVPGIAGIDTRSLTLRLRERGTMRGVLSTEELDPERLADRARGAKRLEETDWVKRVTVGRAGPWHDSNPSPFFHRFESAPPERPLRVAAFDYGIKWNILRSLAYAGCEVTVFPADADAAAVREHTPDGVFLSNGPGDPAVLDYATRTVGELAREYPVFGICLGHQILARALGAETHKLKFGHRGCNHPVKDLATGRVEVTVQNHGYAVTDEGLDALGLEVTHRSLNDGTVEGLRHRELPVFSVQYHPEASAGPHDSKYLFGRFLAGMRGRG